MGALAIMSHNTIRNWQIPTRASMYRALSVLVLGGIIFISATRLNILPGDIYLIGSLEGSGSALRQGLFALGVGIMIVVSRPLIHPAKLIDLPLTIWLLLGWCALSLTWSDVPDIAVRRFVLTFIVIWLCFRTVDEVGQQAAMPVVLYVGVGLLFANLAAVLYFPEAIHHNQGAIKDDSILGAWRGILPEKNGAGLSTAMTLLLLVFGVGRMPLLFRLILIAASMLFLWGTQSKTAMGLTGISIVCGAIFLGYNPRYRLLLIPPLIIAVIGSIIGAVIYLPPYLAHLAGSLDAFTGRIQIWRVMLAYIRDHLWFGAGFASVWNVGPSSPIFQYSSIVWINKAITQGHNGYLDQLMQGGVPGLLLAFLALFIVPFWKIFSSVGLPRRWCALQLAILVFALGYNLTESSMLSSDHFGNVMIMLSIASLTKMTRRQDIGSHHQNFARDRPVLPVRKMARQA